MFIARKVYALEKKKKKSRLVYAVGKSSGQLLIDI